MVNHIDTGSRERKSATALEHHLTWFFLACSHYLTWVERGSAHLNRGGVSAPPMASSNGPQRFIDYQLIDLGGSFNETLCFPVQVDPSG